MSRAEYVGKGTIQGCPVRLGYVFSVGGPKLLEGQRPILAPAEGKLPMVVVAVQGALSGEHQDWAGRGPVRFGFGNPQA